jgi:Trypsin-like peptidase domain
MWEDAATIVGSFKTAAASFDFKAMRELTKEPIAKLQQSNETYPDKQAGQILQQLRNKRLFDEMVALSEAFIRNGQNSLVVRRQYAQAIIDHGQPGLAIQVLEKLVIDSAGSPPEYAEARGLLGRACKQLYVDGTETTPHSRYLLQQALQHYYSVYKSDPDRYYWHGINVVALLDRAFRDGVTTEGYPERISLADRILKTIGVMKSPDAWALATAAEACVALNRPDEACRYLARYVQDPYADAFELASTLRQFEQVWQFRMSSDSDSSAGSTILPFLRSNLLKKSGGSLTIDAADVGGANFERIPPAITYQALLGDAKYVSVDWYKAGLERCRSVGRVHREFETEKGYGTGFLLRGALLNERYPDSPLFLTNAHVISNDPLVRAAYDALAPESARISFTQLGAATRCEVKRIIWTSPPHLLDATLVELDRVVEGPTTFKVAADRPKIDGTNRAYVIGHPKGGPLSFSLDDNLLLDYDNRVAHYRSPTERGSSGSPVFDANWDLICLHHAGSKELKQLNGKQGTYAANEGIWIDAIRMELSAAAARSS